MNQTCGLGRRIAFAIRRLAVCPLTAALLAKAA